VRVDSKTSLGIIRKEWLKHLRNIESDFTNILQDKDKFIEFQLLLKEMEKRLKDEENQFKNSNAD